MSDTETLLTKLSTMRTILGLSRTEKETLDEAIGHIENDEINMCKKIKTMIETNDASTNDILNFCNIFIKSKEEEINGRL